MNPYTDHTKKAIVILGLFLVGITNLLAQDTTYPLTESSQPTPNPPVTANGPTITKKKVSHVHDDLQLKRIFISL